MLRRPPNPTPLYSSAASGVYKRSNLDSEGERALIHAIARVRARGGIVVVIAHRPAVLQAVDHMLVLNEGRMQAFGTTAAVLPLLVPKAAQPAPARRKRKKDAEPRQNA